jgi:adhesin transport system membrane fusion protein
VFGQGKRRRRPRKGEAILSIGPAASPMGPDKGEHAGRQFQVSSAEMAARTDARRFGWLMCLVIGAFLAVFFAWASLATLDEVTRGDGKVIPSGQNKVVQHLEGGIVAAILVREGQQVEPGEVLMRIDSTVSGAQFREKLARYHALQAAAARLRAEANGLKRIGFPPGVLQSAAQEAAEQRRLFRSRRARHGSEVAILEQQVSQRRQQLAEARSRVATLTRRVASLRQELRETERDFRSGAVSRSELEQIRRETNKAIGDLRTERIVVRRTEAALREIEARVRDKKAAFLADVRKELSGVLSQIAALEPSIGASRERVRRTDLRAPVRGIIKQIGIATIGGVVKPGQPLIEIVPVDDRLLVEARIRPEDRAFLRPNQPATVKLSAYDFSIYGGLEGTVIDISADAIEDENRTGSAYYRIRIRTKRNHLLYQGRRLPIIPGMTAAVDIKTGKKTVLDYLFDPVARIVSEALTER